MLLYDLHAAAQHVDSAPPIGVLLYGLQQHSVQATAFHARYHLLDALLSPVVCFLLSMVIYFNVQLSFVYSQAAWLGHTEIADVFI